MFGVKSERWNHGFGLVRANATNVDVSYRTTALRALNAVRVCAHSDFRALTLCARTDVPPARRGWCHSVGVTISTRAVFTPVAARDFYADAVLRMQKGRGNWDLAGGNAGAEYLSRMILYVRAVPYLFTNEGQFVIWVTVCTKLSVCFFHSFIAAQLFRFAMRRRCVGLIAAVCDYRPEFWRSIKKTASGRDVPPRRAKNRGNGRRSSLPMGRRHAHPQNNLREPRKADHTGVC